MKIITVCGSLRFKQEIIEITEKMDLQGNCMLSIVYPARRDIDDYTDEDNPINPTPVVLPPPTDEDNDGSSPMQSLVNNTTNNNTYDESSSDDNSTQDNRVTFEAGSVVFNIDKDTDLSDEGLDVLADKLMKKISRKMQLRNMQTRV